MNTVIYKNIQWKVKYLKIGLIYINPTWVKCKGLCNDPMIKPKVKKN